MVERNIILFHPLSEKLTKLKAELEKDENLILYDVESIDEYNQIIGILEHSITFSSDKAITVEYLENAANFVKDRNSKNTLVLQASLDPMEMKQLQEMGLNDIQREEIPERVFLDKIDSFFSPLEIAEKRAAELKQKEEANTFKVKVQSSKKEESYNTNEKLRIEKMAVYDEEVGQKGNLEISNKSTNLFFGNKDEKKAKRKTDYNFDSPVGELKKDTDIEFESHDVDPLKKALPEFEEKNNYSQKQSDSLNLEEKDWKEKDRPQFEEVSPELSKKSHDIDFDQQAGEKKKKTSEFKEEGIERKSNPLDLDAEVGGKKSGHAAFPETAAEIKTQTSGFEEQLPESVGSTGEFIPVDKKLNKKAVDFNINLDERKKKSSYDFDQTGNDKQKKSSKFNEKNSSKKTSSLDSELAKSDKVKDANLNFEAEGTHPDNSPLGPSKKQSLAVNKGLSFDEVDSEQTNKKLDLKEHDMDVAKRLNLPEKEHEKIRPASFEEQNPLAKTKSSDIEDRRENETKKSVFSLDERSNTKKSYNFKEADKEGISTSKFDEFNQEVNRKQGELEENPLGDNLSRADIETKSQRSYRPGEESELAKNNYREEVLDYRALKDEMKLKGSALDPAQIKAVREKLILKLLEEPELEYFPTESYGLEYLVLYNDFLWKKNIPMAQLFKFAHFSLMKEFEANMSIFTNTDDDSRPFKIYDGHKNNKVNKLASFSSTFEDYETKKLVKWSQVRLPQWEDETFQLDINEFIYPFFEDNNYIGFCVAHFPKTVTDHTQARKAELFCMMVKGAILNISAGGGAQ